MKLLSAAAAVAAVAVAAGAPGDVAIHKSLTGESHNTLLEVQILIRAVNGTVSARKAEFESLKVRGDSASTTLTAKKLRSTLLSVDVVETSVIRSPTGTITIDGNLVLAAAHGESIV